VENGVSRREGVAPATHVWREEDFPERGPPGKRETFYIEEENSNEKRWTRSSEGSSLDGRFAFGRRGTGPNTKNSIGTIYKKGLKDTSRHDGVRNITRLRTLNHREWRGPLRKECEKWRHPYLRRGGGEAKA